MIALSLLMVCVAYLVGSVSSAVLISRLFRLPDPRKNGSGNPGATNVLRIGGRFPAVCAYLNPLWLPVSLEQQLHSIWIT